MNQTSGDTLPVVRLKIERQTSHPWIFQRALAKPAPRLAPGTLVEVVDAAGRWVGRGFYNRHARIGVRLLTSRPEEVVDATFFAQRIRAAVAFRRHVLRLDAVTNAYRLVHAEGDGLSGLVADRFGPVIVLEFFAAGMYRYRQWLLAALQTEFPDARFYYFAEEHVAKQESFDCRSPEPPEPVVITEHGVRFRVVPGSRHKTGFFVDQRDNRLRLSQWCTGKRVLDLCCNSGGFALYAKVKGQAKEVVGVDIDEEALALARVNAGLNQVQIRWVQADLFTWLRDIAPSGQRYDVVVLDPARLTRDPEGITAALKKYCDMNRLAMQVTAPGGILLSCSCTGLVKEEAFLESLRRAAWQAGRTLQVFHISGAGPDHPFLLNVPEGRYLKAVYARVW
ncbi:MAG: class I SAM-dependent rRNA methyltransferase [Gemmataceae bacterium]|nr:class I SAM-dependent rRNA methyltransferase [Gemmataceae bacterium]MDW8242598.1 class I SAM-dependent rRNA methyltransferase [Thermogemmata sp.]